ncbi:MAG: LamG domain-containing protein [Planctomycetes bacterium]|nr:LamG domain-containing protein [Planctomycetota bacterium]
MFRKLTYVVSLIVVLGLVSNASAELVGQWKLDDGAGTTALDATGNGNDGTLEDDPTVVEGQFGQALAFDGSRVVIPASDSLTADLFQGSFTMTAWINPKRTGNTWQQIFRSVRASDTNDTLFINNDGRLSWRGRVGGAWAGGMCETAPDVVPADQWTHVAVTGDETNFRVYVNGALSQESAFQTTDGENETYYIGGDTNFGESYSGIIDDVRVYNHVLSEDDVRASMENQGGALVKAYGADPSSGTLHEDTWITLGWRAGDFAALHDVYIGNNFDAVSEGAEGTFIVNQAATFIVAGFPGFAFPDGLIPGTTYYWRIDEVNDTEPNSPWKGDIWSFSIPPKTAYFPDPADGAESVGVGDSLSWTAGFGAKLHTVYFGETFEEVDNAAGGLPQGTATFSPGELKQAKTYYWRVDEFDVIETHKGDVWSFTTEGAVAALDPANGAVDVTQTPVLTWAPGLGASYEVYFGADEASLELKGSGNLGSESYDAGQLEWDTTYYWRVDEANATNTDSPWTGPLWSFTTANFLIIEDFESYNDLDPADPASNRIFNAWLDGFDNPALNGSVVGNANPPFAEQTIVHSGNQSMPLAYDNAVGKSEATLTLASNRDWTVNGVNTLTIWFRGGSANAAETLYIALNDSAVVDNDDPDAAQKGSWTQWNIDLQAFADQGVNLANVTSITIGLGNRANPVAGGAGMMYFDDIRLYAQ